MKRLNDSRSKSMRQIRGEHEFAKGQRTERASNTTSVSSAVANPLVIPRL